MERVGIPMTRRPCRCPDEPAVQLAPAVLHPMKYAPFGGVRSRFLVRFVGCSPDVIPPYISITGGQLSMSQPPLERFHTTRLSIRSTATPTVMAESATLKAGQCQRS